jgi:hypothetical protein
MNEVLASAVAGQPKLAELAKAVDEAAERGSSSRNACFPSRASNRPDTRLDLNEIVIRAAGMLQQTRRGRQGKTGLFMACGIRWPIRPVSRTPS